MGSGNTWAAYRPEPQRGANDFPNFARDLTTSRDHRADVTGAVLRAQQQMAASIADHAREQARNNQVDVMSSWEARNRIRDGVMQRGSDARRGTTTAYDPVQGSRTVSNAYQSTWTRPDGSIAQTDSTTPPDYNSGWQLMQTPH